MKVISMRGVSLDMSRMIAQNPDKVAIGNANMNARGDVIDRATGKVLRKREQIAMDYNLANPKAVRQGLKSIAAEVLTPAEAVAKADDLRKKAVAEAKKHRKVTDSAE